MFNYNSAASIGIIGTPDEDTIKQLEQTFGKPVKLKVKNGKTKLIIGKGFFKIVFKLSN